MSTTSSFTRNWPSRCCCCVALPGWTNARGPRNTLPAVCAAAAAGSNNSSSSSRPRHSSLASALPADDSTTGDNVSSVAQTQSRPASAAVTSTAATANAKKKRGRPPSRPPVDAQQLLAALASQTQLSPSVARRVVAAVQARPSMPSTPEELCRRVQHLEQLLGPEDAQRALTLHAYIVAYRPQTVAFNFKQWQLFFGTHDSTGVSSPVAKQLQAARQQAIVRRLVRHPHLLCVQVEQQVANLYEMSVLLGVQDPQDFAYKALELSLMTADAVMNKLATVLQVLNTPPQTDTNIVGRSDYDQQQQQQHEQPEPPAASSGRATAAADIEGADLPSRVFVLSDVQAAARRDHLWLALSQDTLEQRLRGMQAELGIPMSQVGAMFLKNPSLLNKKPSTLASKAAALRALPGMQPGHADAMAAALPSLLNLRPEKLQDRWQQLQQAADSHPAWRSALDSMTPSTLAGLLTRGEGRYQRLQRVAQQGLQGRVTLSAVLLLPDSAFENRLVKGEKD